MAKLNPSREILPLPEDRADIPHWRAKATVFEDAASLRLLEEAAKVAPSVAGVIIQGETGTGKELIARLIHRLSGRRGPFVAVNCGAFPEHLAEAEFFGHEAGAYSGAHEARAGWFEAAEGGTLFLDEIGDLPLTLQVKLLRVLQEREVVRLGSRTSRPVDVRVVSATNADLGRAVATGRFRPDLYYRIGVAHVKIAPLRDRPGDIIPLARHFITAYAGRLNIPIPELPPASMDALLRYRWPGNIRELENVLHNAVLVARHGSIGPEDLRFAGIGLSLDEGGNGPVTPLPTQDSLEQVFQRLLADPGESGESGGRGLFDRVEGSLLRLAFERNRGNQVRTAEALGLSRHSVRTLLKRHNLVQD
jgi:sigma-54 dependent transcriptional regulator